MHALGVALSAVAATSGLVFNGYILVILLWQRRFQTANHLLLLHLAIVDIFFCFIILFGNMPLSIISDEVRAALPPAIGPLQGILWSLLPALMAWTICGLSTERYVAICSPFNYSKLVSARRAAAFIGSIWTFGLIISLMPVVGVCNYSFSSSRSSYAIVCNQINSDKLFALVHCAFALVPVIVILVCNLHILLIARNHRHQIVSAIYEITLRATATAVARRDSRSAGSGTVARQRGDTLLMLLITSYLLLMVPSSICFGLETFDKLPVNSTVISVVALSLVLIPNVNAYVYGVKSQLIRSEFKRLFQRYLYQQQASIEIDRRLSLRSQSSLRAAIGWHNLLTGSTNSLLVLKNKATGRRNSAPSFTGDQRAVIAQHQQNQSRRLSLNQFSVSLIEPSDLLLSATVESQLNSSVLTMLDAQDQARFSHIIDSDNNLLTVGGGCRVQKQMLSPIEEASSVSITASVL